MIELESSKTPYGKGWSYTTFLLFSLLEIIQHSFYSHRWRELAIHACESIKSHTAKNLKVCFGTNFKLKVDAKK